DMVAIVRTGSGVGALQQFTTDKRLLLAAINALKPNILFSDRFMEMTDLPDGERRAAEYGDLRSWSGTIAALHFVIRGMGEMPGRKSVVLLSDGWRIGQRDREGRMIDYGDAGALRRLIDSA